MTLGRVLGLALGILLTMVTIDSSRGARHSFESARNVDFYGIPTVEDNSCVKIFNIWQRMVPIPPGIRGPWMVRDSVTAAKQIQWLVCLLKTWVPIHRNKFINSKVRVVDVDCCLDAKKREEKLRAAPQKYSRQFSGRG